MKAQVLADIFLARGVFWNHILAVTVLWCCNARCYKHAELIKWFQKLLMARPSLKDSLPSVRQHKASQGRVKRGKWGLRMNFSMLYRPNSFCVIWNTAGSEELHVISAYLQQEKKYQHHLLTWLSLAPVLMKEVRLFLHEQGSLFWVRAAGLGFTLLLLGKVWSSHWINQWGVHHSLAYK